MGSGGPVIEEASPVERIMAGSWRLRRASWFVGSLVLIAMFAI